MSKFKQKHEGPVSVKFTVSSFRYKGVEYKSAEVMKAAEEGNEEAQAIIANLVQIKSGNIEVTDIAKAKPAKAKATAKAKANASSNDEEEEEEEEDLTNKSEDKDE